MYIVLHVLQYRLLLFSSSVHLLHYNYNEYIITEFNQDEIKIIPYMYFQIFHLSIQHSNRHNKYVIITLNDYG